MKIAILYICTGNYSIFWKDFYLSSEKYFLPGTQKEYFVFTDASEIDFERENPGIHRIFQENLGWPGNTLKRYQVFLKKKDEINKFDYVFYLNANLSFLSPVENEDFLPIGNEKLVACLHPGYFNKPRTSFTYEKNQLSTAFIPANEGEYYFAGGINGGVAENFILAMEKMEKNIIDDLSKNLITVWHDESHWNRYLAGRKDVKILTPSYLYPEGSRLPLKKIILVRDKKMLGGHAALRGKLELRLIVNDFKNFLKTFFKGFKIPNVVSIKGGLGNQMFQYAYGRAEELRGKNVFYDLSFYYGGKSSGEIQREYKLDVFNIKPAGTFVKNKVLLISIINKIRNLLGGGYFQSEKYFSSVSYFIKKEFTLKEKIGARAEDVLNKILGLESVSIHIRRGDYVTDQKTNAYHGVCGKDYYDSAIKLIKQKHPASRFFIFSDDIAWAKENFAGTEFHFVSAPDIKDYEELILMSKCKHNIIANSSFSWWGAWLNANPEKLVVAPKKWFNKEPEKGKDIVPENWLKV